MSSAQTVCIGAGPASGPDPVAAWKKRAAWHRWTALLPLGYMAAALGRAHGRLGSCDVGRARGTSEHRSAVVSGHGPASAMRASASTASMSAGCHTPSKQARSTTVNRSRIR